MVNEINGKMGKLGVSLGVSLGVRAMKAKRSGVLHGVLLRLAFFAYFFWQ